MSPLTILTNIILPILILLGLGFALDKAFRLDIHTLSKVNFYIFTPIIIFVVILNSDLRSSEVFSITKFALLQMVLVGAAAWFLFSLKSLREQRPLLLLASVFVNSGNYGFPLMLLAFGDRSVSIIAVVLVVQLGVLFTAGILLLLGGEVSLKHDLLGLLKLPSLYAIVIGFGMRALELSLPAFIIPPLEHVADGFIAMALITLGAQLSQSRVLGNVKSVASVVGLRLVVSPLIAVILVSLLQLTPELSAVLIVGAGLPTAVNVFNLATEYERGPELASQVVLWTTLLSAVTIPVLLSLIL